MQITDRINKLERKMKRPIPSWDLSRLSVNELLELKELTSSDPAGARRLTKEYIENGKVRYENNGTN